MFFFLRKMKSDESKVLFTGAGFVLYLYVCVYV